ncbi:hypothetical protein K470DRAFT_269176 [Piedraia hortae CBS 480.64]|uniref:Uncharacterized protein n=1 Tax=Piedraia hortae CBS 480.64 TaxID=1314780 RepID=A0A6A7C3M8_9PEZI|nr:hypothetical protein K470DRAFT_269176 [Piedraia hortae CBS 480.64]
MAFSRLDLFLPSSEPVDYDTCWSSSTATLVDGLKRRLMTAPHRPLELNFNGVLLRILEEYHVMSDQVERLNQAIFDKDGEIVALESTLEEKEADIQALKAKLEYKECSNECSNYLSGTTADEQSFVPEDNEKTEVVESPVIPEPKVVNDEDEIDQLMRIIDRLRRSDRLWNGQRAYLRPRKPLPPRQGRFIEEGLKDEYERGSYRPVQDQGTKHAFISKASGFFHRMTSSDDLVTMTATSDEVDEVDDGDSVVYTCGLLARPRQGNLRAPTTVSVCTIPAAGRHASCSRTELVGRSL